MHNLSTIMLPTEELDVFKCGLKNPIYPLDINKTCFDKIFWQLLASYLEQ